MTRRLIATQRLLRKSKPELINDLSAFSIAFHHPVCRDLFLARFPQLLQDCRRSRNDCAADNLDELRFLAAKNESFTQKDTTKEVLLSAFSVYDQEPDLTEALLKVSSKNKFSDQDLIEFAVMHGSSKLQNSLLSNGFKLSVNASSSRLYQLAYTNDLGKAQVLVQFGAHISEGEQACFLPSRLSTVDQIAAYRLLRKNGLLTWQKVRNEDHDVIRVSCVAMAMQDGMPDEFVAAMLETDMDFDAKVSRPPNIGLRFSVRDLLDDLPLGTISEGWGVQGGKYPNTYSTYLKTFAKAPLSCGSFFATIEDVDASKRNLIQVILDVYGENWCRAEGVQKLQVPQHNLRLGPALIAASFFGTSYFDQLWAAAASTDDGWLASALLSQNGWAKPVSLTALQKWGNASVWGMSKDSVLAIMIKNGVAVNAEGVDHVLQVFENLHKASNHIPLSLRDFTNYIIQADSKFNSVDVCSQFQQQTLYLAWRIEFFLESWNLNLKLV